MFFTLELWHSPAGMSQPAGTSTLTKLFFLLFFLTALETMFCFEERGSRCSLCVNGRQILLLVKISSVCGWCYIQIMLFLETQWRQHPLSTNGKSFLIRYNAFMATLTWGTKHVLEVLTLRLLILGEGRRFYWKKRKSSHVFCLLVELYTTFL